MKTKDEKISIQKELKRKKLEHANYKWIIKIVTLAFIISLVFSFLSETMIPTVNIFLGVIILVLFILIGIIFDMIGVAVQAADEKPFHSMNSRKVKAADIAVIMKKNADKVSSFCNDVIGDICGIISGTTGSIIATKLALHFNLDNFIVILFVTALISALTIGGKAMGKSVAINKSNNILYKFAKFLSHFYSPKK